MTNHISAVQYIEFAAFLAVLTTLMIVSRETWLYAAEKIAVSFADRFEPKTPDAPLSVTSDLLEAAERGALGNNYPFVDPYMDSSRAQLQADTNAYLDYIVRCIKGTDCRLPTKGWFCSEKKFHPGPCAARPIPIDAVEETKAGQYFDAAVMKGVGDEMRASTARLQAEIDRDPGTLPKRTGNLRQWWQGYTVPNPIPGDPYTDFRTMAEAFVDDPTQGRSFDVLKPDLSGDAFTPAREATPPEHQQHRADCMSVLNHTGPCPTPDAIDWSLNSPDHVAVPETTVKALTPAQWLELQSILCSPDHGPDFRAFEKPELPAQWEPRPEPPFVPLVADVKLMAEFLTGAINPAASVVDGYKASVREAAERVLKNILRPMTLEEEQQFAWMRETDHHTEERKAATAPQKTRENPDECSGCIDVGDWKPAEVIAGRWAHLNRHAPLEILCKGAHRLASMPAVLGAPYKFGEPCPPLKKGEFYDYAAHYIRPDEAF